MSAVAKSVETPDAAAEECIEFSLEAGHDYANVRGKPLPFVLLRNLFGRGDVALILDVSSLMQKVISSDLRPAQPALA